MVGEILTGSFSGALEKRSRKRNFLARLSSGADENTWKRREFRLNGQLLSYWDGNKKKGEVNIKDNKIQKMVSEEMNGREFGFELTLISEKEGMAPERLYLAAESSFLRAKWISILNVAAKDDKWQLRPRTLLKKTGKDIALALTASYVDDRQVLTVETFRAGAQLRDFEKRINEVEAVMDRLQEENKSGVNFKVKLQIRDYQEKLNEINKEKHAYIIQSFIRRCLARRRLRLKRNYNKGVSALLRLLRTKLWKRHYFRSLREQQAAHKIKSMIIRKLAKIRSINRLQNQPRVIIVDHVSGVGIKFEESSASHDFFFYAMSCHDPNHLFRGQDETRVENGYSLLSTSVFRSGGISFNTSPCWKDESGTLTGSTKDCFIVLSLVTKGPSASAQEVFHGQAIVKLTDCKEIFDGYGTVRTCEVPLIKYVAPVETTAGSSILSINDAMHRKVEGKLSFKLHVPPHTKTMTGWIFKESGRLLSSAFKRRFFVLVEGCFYYAHSDSELGNIKHSIQCREVTAITKEKSKGNNCWRVHYFSLQDQRKGSWLLYFPSNVGPEIQDEWKRKLHRCCKQLPNMELNRISSPSVRGHTSPSSRAV